MLRWTHGPIDLWQVSYGITEIPEDINGLQDVTNLINAVFDSAEIYEVGLGEWRVVVPVADRARAARVWAGWWIGLIPSADGDPTTAQLVVTPTQEELIRLIPARYHAGLVRQDNSE